MNKQIFYANLKLQSSKYFVLSVMQNIQLNRKKNISKNILENLNLG
jgi:hypothetical protein